MLALTLARARRLACRRTRTFVPIALVIALSPAVASAQGAFAQTNLVSDVPGLASTLDPQLRNPWGMSFSATSPFWISDERAGVSTLYNASGVKQALVVTVPGPGTAQGTPTGQVFNGTMSFKLPNGNPARFIFAGLGGTIAGWNSGATAVTMIDGSAMGASYTGLAMATTAGGPTLFAANFGAGRIDAFDAAFAPVVLPGAFTDPTLPAGYAPFNVEAIGGQLYVTYALKDPITGEDVAGPGHGFVDVYDPTGVLVRRLVSDGTLNSPWGLTMAPPGFGPFGSALLVGNFGDGTINAFNPGTGAFLGQLHDPTGAPIVNDGLWALAFRSGAGFDPGTLYLTAGIEDEEHGLFAAITAVPEPGTLGLLLTGLGALALVTARRRRSPHHV